MKTGKMSRKIDPAKWLKWKKTRLIYLYRDIYNVLKFGHGCAPLAAQKIYIRPAEITKCVLSFSRTHSGMTVDGDWDLMGCELEETPKIAVCRRRFVQGLTWEEAGAFDIMAREFDRGSFPDGCRDWNDVRCRYEKLDRLFEKFCMEKKFFSRKKLRGRRAFREHGGVYVHVGRHGEAIFGGGGFHRLAMAKFAGIERIPAQLGVVHMLALQNRTFYSLLDKNPEK